MAQSVRRPEVLGAVVEHKLQREKNRTSYFGNVKTRLGSKLPAGVKQPPEFTKGPHRSTQKQVQVVNDATDNCTIHHHPNAGRTLNRVPHIRNPKLRQYYLQGIPSEQNNVTVKPGYENGQQHDKPSGEGLPVPADTVFSISSHLKNNSTLADKTKTNPDPSPSSHVSTLSSTLIPRQQLRVPKENKSFTSQGSSLSELNPDPDPDPELRLQPQLVVADPGCSHSPSPDAEYDKLLDVEAVPMPDGHTCLLALPPECTEGEGPTVMPYLKLFCRYITDRKGVVSGVLLVTSNKIFFDPCKTHPLVMEHGCEEYLMSCSIDCLASVTFFSDITHVHFNPSQLRWKGPKSVQKSKAECLQGSSSNHEAEAVPALVSAAMSKVQSTPALSLSREVSEEGTAETRDMAETESQLDGGPPEDEGAQSAGTLGVAVLSGAASLCCGGQDVGSKVKMELLHTDKREKGSYVKDQTAVPQRLPSCCPGDLMFIRMRVHQAAGKKKTIAGLRLGTAKTLPRRDSWLAVSKESSDELYAYLAHCRPDVCILEGEGAGGDGDEEEFVVIEDREEEADKEEEVFQSHWCSGDEWEMVSVEESVVKPVVIDKDPEGLSEIVAQSRILDASLIRELCAELPPRTIGHTWHLSYSTSCHGSSLKTLYRKLSNTESPALIVIRDALDQVFGSFLSHPLRISETFYGTGETFLFMLHPRFKCFRWTGENSFFIKGDLDSFAVGGGSGHFGLWLDETLYLGRSSPCYTFNNCCLSETDDFRVMDMEVWTFS